MMEIIILGILVMLMAKRGRGSRKRAMGKYLKGNVDENLDLGTLASRTLVRVAFDETVNERTLVSSIEALISMADFTPADGSGPITVGIAHSDYTAAEIEEVIENTGSWNEGNLVQSREVAKRLVRVLGIFPSSPGGGATGIAVLNDGKPIKEKLNWILLQGQTLALWAYNQGSAAVGGTDPNITLQGHANLFPK